MRDREIAELVGANIRRCRTEHHWSLAELGERVGLDEATLSRIERAERGLDTVVLRRIADVFAGIVNGHLNSASTTYCPGVRQRQAANAAA